ncbi:MAG: S24 family peptidase [Mesorhizobium sp.]
MLFRIVNGHSSAIANHASRLFFRIMSKILIQRLKTRLDETGRTAREVSIAAAGNPDTLRKLFKGITRMPKADVLAALATELGTTPEWLIGEADQRAPAPRAEMAAGRTRARGTTLPVFGMAAGSITGHHTMTSDPIEEVRAPEVLANVVGAYALLTRGESMIPRYFPNDRLYIHPHQQVRPGDHVIIQTRLHDSSGTETWVKRYDGETDDEVLVSQYNPPGRISFKKRYVVYIHRVLPVNELLPA